MKSCPQKRLQENVKGVDEMGLTGLWSKGSDI